MDNATIDTARLDPIFDQPHDLPPFLCASPASGSARPAATPLMATRVPDAPFRSVNRVFDTHHDIVDACCNAWNALTKLTGKIREIASRQWATVKL